MSAIRSIARNSVFLTISYVVSTFFNFFFFYYTTRYLGTAGYGVLTFALAFTGILNVLNDIGLSTILTREVARDREHGRKYLLNVIVLKTALVAATMLISIALAVLLQGPLKYDEETMYVIILISISNIALTFASMFNSLFQAYEKLEYQSLSGILSSVLMLAGALYAYYAHLSVVQFSIVYVIVNLIILGFGVVVCAWKFFLPGAEVDVRFSRGLLSEAWPMGVMSFSQIAYARVSSLLLEPMQGQVAVGLYNAAYRLSDMSTTVSSVFTASLFPVIAKYHHDSKSSFLYAYQKSLKYLLIVALPMALTVTLLAGPIIEFISGPEYAGSADALSILIWAAVLCYVTAVLNVTLINSNMQRFSMKVVLCSIGVNLVANIILIPQYSYIGTAIATILTELFVLLVEFYYLHRMGYGIDLVETMLVPAITLAVSAAAAWFILSMGMDIFVAAGTALVVYGIIILVFGTRKDDWMLFQSIIKRD